MQNNRISIKINQPLVALFADLTGDKSSLHTDDTFARRSMYRSNVAHGMLPVMFIVCVPGLMGYKNVNFRKISARFLNAVYMDDEIELIFSLVSDDKKKKVVEAEYTFKKKSSGMVLTTGHFSVEYDRPAVSNDKIATHSPRLISKSISENQYSFEGIKKGLKESFDFTVSPESLVVFHQILEKGLAVNDLKIKLGHQSFPNLLALSLFSTFVGVCIPGQRATFLDFTANFDDEIILNKKYHFRGEVVFKSQSTSTLVEELNIFESGSTKSCAQGKLKTQVNEGKIHMMSIHDIKKDCLDLKLKDKVVLITGSSRGIGEVTAKLFAIYGAKVIVNYFKGEQDAKRIVEEIVADKREAICLRADVANRQEVKSMVEQIIRKYGKIDILVNNAARDFLPSAFMDLTWEDFQKDIDVIVKGAFNCCQEVLPLMIKNKNGKIINVGTVATDAPPAKQAKYVVAKSALVGLTRSLAVELAPFNIQVNMVSPFMVETDFVKHVPKMFLEKIRQETPMNRNAAAIDVARAVIALASSLSSFTTGQKVLVTGGNAPFL